MTVARTRELARFVDTTLTCQGALGTVETGTDDWGFTVTEFVPTWSGRCMIYARDLDPRQVVAGEQSYTITRYTVVLPPDAPVEVGDLLRITSAPDAPDMTDLDYRIVDAPHNAWNIARMCVAETTTSG